MHATKLKTGDKVRLMADTGFGADRGAIATVTRVRPGDTVADIDVMWDKSDPRVNNQMDGGYGKSYFMLIDRPTMEWDHENNRSS